MPASICAALLHRTAGVALQVWRVRLWPAVTPHQETCPAGCFHFLAFRAFNLELGGLISLLAFEAKPCQGPRWLQAQGGTGMGALFFLI